MATGKQMLEAVQDAVRRRPELTELRISIFDSYDLFKLKPSDLSDMGVECEHAELISSDLLKGSLNQLGNWLGMRLIKDKNQRNLIQGEGFRRTSGIWANGNDDPDSIVEEVRQLRNPGAR